MVNSLQNQDKWLAFCGLSVLYTVIKNNIWSYRPDDTSIDVQNIAQPIFEKTALLESSPVEVSEEGMLDGASAKTASVAGSIFGYVWDSLSWQTKIAVGLAGVLGAAYLVNRLWKGNGVHITNNNTNQVHINLHVTPELKTKITRTDDKNGISLSVAIEPSPKEKFKAIVRKVIEQNREQKLLVIKNMLRN